MALSSISSTDNIYYFRHRTRRRVLAFVRFVILFYIIYQIVATMLLSSYTVGSAAMAPQVAPGDHLLVAPVVYGAPVPFTRLRLPAIHEPRRGDIVLVHPAYTRPDPWYIRLADPVVRFFTGQSVRIGNQPRVGNGLVVARVLAVPGDTVEVRGDLVSVKPSGAAAFSSELELVHKKYDITKRKLPAGWSSDLPFSGNMAPISLEAGQYFVVGDNREAASDSITWGPVSESRIVGKVILRYWPLKKIAAL